LRIKERETRLTLHDDDDDDDENGGGEIGESESTIWQPRDIFIQFS